jgi:hypothetical protein
MVDVERPPCNKDPDEFPFARSDASLVKRLSCAYSLHVSRVSIALSNATSIDVGIFPMWKFYP